MNEVTKILIINAVIIKNNKNITEIESRAENTIPNEANAFVSESNPVGEKIPTVTEIGIYISKINKSPQSPLFMSEPLSSM